MTEVPTLKEEFEVFRRIAQRCRKVYDTHGKLFSRDAKTAELLRAIADNFFNDLADWLADYHIILVARLTDPANTMSRTNLSSLYLVEALRGQNLLTPEIEGLSSQLTTYREKIVNWRNKTIVHTDHDAAFTVGPSEAHSLEDVESFHSALDGFCSAVSERLKARPLSTIRIAESFHGVSALIMALKRVQRFGDDR
ncbi:MAG: hypothetical protein Q8Q63_03715 [Phaeovulum sp.]|uniref:AbiU2 domain-containing protein n=1 Tax=Phaeovulum sp. TaxID=2934796 RepID=UPI0027368490|nr:hypothetical protein [Phaeovulum sp.]MDP3860673.1 hypothetical protein [Phaeovulum sp.]